ncbi:MAG: primosomal protein N' [Candidatus Latescibacteria bacterium]|nr:primosomal protein N' [Candidatus Latescibacterota bacterium]
MTGKSLNTANKHQKTYTRYASIALPVPINTFFIYEIPGEMVPAAEIGRRALVPFGKRLLTGFIVGLSDNPGDIPVSKIKKIQSVIDSEPVFDNNMFKLAQWVADYYLCTPGEVLKVATPSGTTIQSRLLAHYVVPPNDFPISLTGRQKKTMELLSESKSLSVKHIEKKLSFKVSGILKALEKKGLVRIEHELTTPSVRIKTERHVKPESTPTQDTLPPRAKKQLQCLEVIKDHPDGIVLVELAERHGFSRGVINALVSGGFAYYDDVEITRRSGILDQEKVEADFPLMTAQKSSYDLIMKEAEGETPRPILLKGITGSGKTRVYIELVKQVLKVGKGAIILVPEISLTPQTTRFFSSIFPNRVAVLHSAMSAGERYDAWRHVHSGVFDVVIGPRSAVFAPLQNPGIIIVDEEHDTSYKQTDTTPRYHARDVAVVRGHMLGIPVVLGSATPSLESWHNATTGKYALAVLPERVDSRPLPEIITVDMREEWAADNRSSLSRRLREEIIVRIERKEKSIILINRRGFASLVRCRDCGYAQTCPQCSVGLTYHSSKGLALCHMCGHKQLILEHCPQCGSTELQYRGAGTQRIEQELKQIIGKNNIVRMDSDTTKAHDAHYRLLEEFRSGPAPILLGTQMIAKGHDIPEVTLVGVISADQSLYIPDFRAGERTFQLITQVAGRAGRGETPGIVILQSFYPDNYAITAASKQDFETFAEYEMPQREELEFPPYKRLILIELSSDILPGLEILAGEIARYLSEHVPEGAEVFGPVSAPIAMIKGRHRIHILIKSHEVYRLRSILRYIMENLHSGKETIEVIVDPVEIL